jgi:HPt (histidine-containing phosphotransfer) domain-containing protein
MKDSGPQDQFAERNRDRLVQVQELVREVGVETARIRERTAVLEALDTDEWQRAQRWAHNIAARAQALNLGVLASCAWELERFAGDIVVGDPEGQTTALRNAAIAIETIDLELSVLSKGERPG